MVFKDRNFAPDAPSHYYVVIPAICGSLTLCIITSQVAKRHSYYNDCARKSLVNLSKGDFTFITKPSIIDCNSAELLSRQELEVRAEQFNRKPREKIPGTLKKQIIHAVLNSPLVREVIKKSLPTL